MFIKLTFKLKKNGPNRRMVNFPEYCNLLYILYSQLKGYALMSRPLSE